MAKRTSTSKSMASTRTSTATKRKKAPKKTGTTTTRKRRTRKPKEPEAKTLHGTTQKEAQLQPHIAAMMAKNPNETPPKVVIDRSDGTQKKRNTARASKGQVGTNPNMNKSQLNARYNTTRGLGGPNAEKVRNITARRYPIAVTDPRQLLSANANNMARAQIRNRAFPLPMQEILPTRGGFHSGRTRQVK